MPYVLPSAAAFKVRFSEFDQETDERVTALIAEASGSVDQSWIEADYQSAILYLTAHLLAQEEQLSALGEAVLSGALPGPVAGAVSGYAAGDTKITFSGAGGGSSSASSAYASEFASTMYGQRFLVLQRRSHPAIMVV